MSSDWLPLHAARALSESTASSLEGASIAKIIGTGALLGLVHVLTGPDHLSALAALATSSSWKAFALGVRWGLGHSTGLIIMAGIFFAAGQTIDLDEIGAYCNYIVGVFMIALGVWTMYHVRRKYREKCKDELRRESVATPSVPMNESLLPTSIAAASASVEPTEQAPYYSTPLTPEQRAPSLVVVGASVSMTTAAASSPRTSTASFRKLNTIDGTSTSDRNGYRFDESSTSVKEVMINVEDPASEKKVDSDEGHRHAHMMCKCCANISYSNPTTQRITALCVGIVHGIAGPGGILGVLPAVVLNNWGKSIAYLGSFCVASILTMGIFAAVYGEATGRLGRNSPRMELRISLCSASFSIIVGVAWIMLQGTGVMDKVFD